MRASQRKKIHTESSTWGRDLLFLLIFSAVFSVSCRSEDPMDPYRNLGAPKGFKRDSYEENVHRKKSSAGSRKTGKSMFGDFFEQERENKRKFRDVSKPMDRGTVQIFPWRGEENRSSRLHEQIRKENKRSDALYY
jgi:hypothetical protein